jgi:hypothetical protein
MGAPFWHRCRLRSYGGVENRACDRAVLNFGGRRLMRPRTPCVFSAPWLVAVVDELYLFALVVYFCNTHSCTRALASRPPALMSVLEKTNPGPRLLGG